MRSRSLWDTTLVLPVDEPGAGETHQHEIPGPAGTRLLVAERQVILKIGEREVPVRVAAAIDLAGVTNARAAFASDLAVALGLLGAVLAIATAVQVGLGLRPLNQVRQGIAEIRSGQARRLTGQGPDEVQPLMAEVNALLDARAKEIERSRHRAADLAHGLKTPLAALAADSEQLRSRGDAVIAEQIESAIDVMRRHIDRELARARVHGKMQIGHGPELPVLSLVRSLVATLERTAAGARLRYETAIAGDAMVPFDRTDLAEVLGNLLENATRHAKTRVRVTARQAPDGLSIDVEDDGPGIVPELRPIALARGGRLDVRGERTGLGLAIVQDVLEAYGWTLRLDTSDLGGLKATCAPRPDA
jgi:signal transduction histidine kinase